MLLRFSAEPTNTSVREETYVTLSFFNFCFNNDDLEPTTPTPTDRAPLPSCQLPS